MPSFTRIADEEADHIGGVAVGAVAVVSAICAKSFGSRRPRKAFFVRKEAKPHGMRKQIEGHPPGEGSEAILFEDVTTTGGSAMVAVDALRKIGCEVKTIYTIVDRGGRSGGAVCRDRYQACPAIYQGRFRRSLAPSALSYIIPLMMVGVSSVMLSSPLVQFVTPPSACHCACS